MTVENPPAPVRFPPGQTLLFDADDTLWENNKYFEHAIASFISYLDHRIHTDEEVREHLNVCERATIAEHGYGVHSFRRSLINCFEQLADAPLTPEKHARIVAFTESISSHEIELLPAVEPTLASLSERHRLVLVTKGQTAEQLDKLQRSGLSTFFSDTEVLLEKNLAAYRDVISRHNLTPAMTWMVGNSPKSDINPALAAGLNAVFVPHDFTWVLEHEAVDQPQSPQRLLELGSFAEMLKHF